MKEREGLPLNLNFLLPSLGFMYKSKARVVKGRSPEAFQKIEQYNRPDYTFEGIADPN